MLRPGDTLNFTTAIEVDDREAGLSHVWVTWTPPPIRRRRVRASRPFPLNSHLDPDSALSEQLDELRRDKRKKRKPTPTDSPERGHDQG